MEAFIELLEDLVSIEASSALSDGYSLRDPAGQGMKVNVLGERSKKYKSNQIVSVTGLCAIVKENICLMNCDLLGLDGAVLWCILLVFSREIGYSIQS